MIAYKALQIRGKSMENKKETQPLSYIFFLLKEKAFPRFEKECIRAYCLFSKKAIYAHNTLKKNIYGHYSAFSDAVNGREDIVKGGAASFFLKSVADHKKKLRNRK